MSSDAPQRRWPDDALPPVEAPNASFIIQLFVIPAVIVGVIVMVWMLFNWLAQMGNDPLSYVKALERNNEARWQAAVNLADALRDPRNVELKRNEAVAERLAGILDAEIEAHRTDKNSRLLRVYLCNALGDFTVPQVVPPLVRAATAPQDDDEKYVRFAAIKGLTVFASGLPGGQSHTTSQILPVMLAAASDAEPLVRSTAAFALGALGGKQAIDRLSQLLNDAYPNVRYNAALMLASHGQIAAARVLVEMLNPKNTVPLVSEEAQSERDAKRETILFNALRAVKKLAGKNPTANLVELRSAIVELKSADVEPRVQVEAADVLKDLERRAPLAKAG